MSILEIIIVVVAIIGLTIWGILLFIKAKKKNKKKEDETEIIEIKKEDEQ